MDIKLSQCFIASPADKEAMSELLAKGLLRGVIFRTDDCDATFERIRVAGGEVLQEPIDQPYGVRDCAFRDPSATCCVSASRAGGELWSREPGATLPAN